ncbi:MAG: gamma-glutamyl-gamma-aminobutyrate hydrolase family protein [Planctomycetota bacterium]
MKPLIGVSSNFRIDPLEPHRPQLYLDATYHDAVLAAGGTPHLTPVPDEYDDALLDEILAGFDGLIFTGGFDLHPRHFDQAVHPRTTLLHRRRDRLEVALFRRADVAELPILAICLGHQVAHVARGGQLVQHVDELGLTPALTHYLPQDANAFHRIAIESGSRLAEIVGATDMEVNSRHHQIVDQTRPGRGLRPVAFAPDGVLEASEDCDGRFLLSVQWHPESLFDRPEHLRLFEALVAEAGRHHRR